MRTVRASTSPRLLAGGLAAVVAVTGSDASAIGYGGRSCPRHRTAAVWAQFARPRTLRGPSRSR
jgi:hypothetical protein